MLVTYQTLINEINQIPVSFLQDVYDLLHTYQVQINQKEQNRKKILEYAGDWADLSEQDFLDIKAEIERNRKEMFNKEIDL